MSETTATILSVEQKATEKAKILLQLLTYEDLSKRLGIARQTLYRRLAEDNWKLGEIALLEKL